MQHHVEMVILDIITPTTGGRAREKIEASGLLSMYHTSLLPVLLAKAV